MLDGADHERVVVEEVNEVGQFTNGHIHFVGLNHRNQHRANQPRLLDVFRAEGSEKHFLELLDGHETSFVLDAFIHGLAHIV